MEGEFIAFPRDGEDHSVRVVHRRRIGLRRQLFDGSVAWCGLVRVDRDTFHGNSPRRGICRLVTFLTHMGGAKQGYFDLPLGPQSMSQMMKVFDLAPDIQERILFLPSIKRLNERNPHPVVSRIDWHEQPRLFQEICGLEFPAAKVPES